MWGCGAGCVGWCGGPVGCCVAGLWWWVGAWGRASSPYGYADEYFRRAQIMREMGPIRGAPEDPILLAMGFLFAHDEVDTAIVGTHNPAHLRANIEMVESDLPIPSEAVEELHRRFDAVGEEWPGIL